MANNLVDVILTTLESKLRGVENLDKAVQLLMRRIDGMERSFQGKYESLAKNWQNEAQRNKNRFGVIVKKLNHLTKKFDSVCEEDVKQIEEIVALPSILRQSRILQPSGEAVFTSNRVLKGSEDDRTTRAVTKAVEEVKDTLAGMDRRLAFHINVVAENMGEMHSKVNELHSSLMINGRNATKVDQILHSLEPVDQMKEQIDRVHQVLQQTQSSINQLVPLSRELLTKGQRDERAITDIRNDLNDKTNSIIEEINRVKGLDDNLLLLNTRSEGDLQVSESLESAFLTATGPSGDDFAQENVIENGTEVVYGRLKGTTGQRRPSVIFPSIENKPVFANSSFSYETGKNLGGISGYSCADLYSKGLRQSGIYYLQIGGTTFWYLKVYCDMDLAEGGWTVMQRRGDYGEPRESFNRGWDDYKFGFGDPRQEFWLGNENIFMMTSSEDYELRIQLEDFEGNQRFAHYGSFRLGSEKDDYRLEISDYEGNAGDSLNDPWYGSNLRPFSTHDSDNDRSSLNCASMLKGGWWWKSCGRGLNGLYLTDPQDLTARQGIVWFRWKGWDYTLKSAQMMIRPKSFKSRTDSRTN